MVVAAYLAGLVTTPAAAIGVWLGLRWWGRLRRSGAATAADAPDVPVTFVHQNPNPLPKCGVCDWCQMGAMFCRRHALPPTPPSQSDAVVTRMRFGVRPSSQHFRRR